MDQTLETYYKNPVTKLEKKIAELGPWFHNIHLPEKKQTAPDHPLGDFPNLKWQQFCNDLPKNLNGWSVLDIGCNAGFYSFKLAERGANVLGIDHDDHYLKQAEWLNELFGFQNQVSFQKLDAYTVDQLEREFDLVLFMGVFYHLRYPLYALDKITRLVKKLLVFQTLTMPGQDDYQPPENLGILERDNMLSTGWPKMAFIENYLEGDETNWWAPNDAAVKAMLRSSGMKLLSQPAHEFYLCRPDEDR